MTQRESQGLFLIISHLCRQSEWNLSIQMAPNGAVSKMDTTATVKTMLPQDSPMARGMVPMAAWTVAFGV